MMLQCVTKKKKNYITFYSRTTLLKAYFYSSRAVRPGSTTYPRAEDRRLSSNNLLLHYIR